MSGRASLLENIHILLSSRHSSGSTNPNLTLSFKDRLVIHNSSPFHLEVRSCSFKKWWKDLPTPRSIISLIPHPTLIIIFHIRKKRPRHCPAEDGKECLWNWQDKDSPALCCLVLHKFPLLTQGREKRVKRASREDGTRLTCKRQS